MKIYKISAQKRVKTGKAVTELIDQDLIPGVVYGPEIKENILIKIPSNNLEKLYNEAGESSLINLNIEGEEEPYETVIKAVDYDPLVMKIRHIDFYKVKRGQKIEAVVELEFVGEAPAVKALGATFVTPMSELRIKCLPKDLVSEVEVDISSLAEYGDTIMVKDLNIPETIEVLEDENSPVAAVEEVRVEEEPVGAPEEEMPEGEEGESAEGTEGGAEAKPAEGGEAASSEKSAEADSGKKE